MHDDMMNRSPDKHEAAMARADLYKLANYSMKLFKMIQEGQELEGWVQAKITKAADYVASVYHFMEYEMKASDYGSKLENSDVYSESVRRAFEQKLMEAKKQAAKVKKDADKVEEGWDDMLKAAKERSGPKPSGGSGIKKGSRYGGSKQVDAPEKDDDEEEKPKKNKKVREGGYYDPANDQPQKGSAASQAVAQRAAMAAAQPPKGVNFEKDYLEKAASGAPGRWMISADDAKTALTWLAANPNYKPPGGGKGVQEAAKPDYLDFDKDGNKKEPMKKALKDKKVKEDTRVAMRRGPGADMIRYEKDSPAPGAKKHRDDTAKAVKDLRASGQKLKKDDEKKVGDKTVDRYSRDDVKEGTGKCNESAKGKMCPTHGLKECPMSEAKNLKQQAAIAIAKKKAK